MLQVSGSVIAGTKSAARARLESCARPTGTCAYAILGRGDDGPPQPERDKASKKGSSTLVEPNERPDLSSDRAETGGIGTAYRIRTGDLRLERAVS